MGLELVLSGRWGLEQELLEPHSQMLLKDRPGF